MRNQHTVGLGWYPSSYSLEIFLKCHPNTQSSIYIYDMYISIFMYIHIYIHKKVSFEKHPKFRFVSQPDFVWPNAPHMRH